MFRVGHRVGLEISSSAFTKYDWNLNTSEQLGITTVMVVAEQRVYHDDAHPSAIVLPIILAKKRIGEQELYTEGLFMAEITDEYMREMLTKTKQYCVVILKAGPHKDGEGVEKIIWEYGRRNFSLRAEGMMPIVCPIRDGSEVSGIGIFDAPVEEVRKIMDEDPGVQAGVFVYEIHPCRSFPGASLP